MSTSQPPKTLQPPHITAEHAFLALVNGYPEAELQSITEDTSKLAFEYIHQQNKSDRDAMFKYRQVIKEFAKANPAGVWNFTTVYAGFALWDRKIGKLVSKQKDAESIMRKNATNLLQILQDARKAARRVQNGSRTQAWQKEMFDLFRFDTEHEPEQREPQDQKLPALGVAQSGLPGASGTQPPCEATGSLTLKRASSAILPTHGQKRSLRFSVSSASEDPPGRAQTLTEEQKTQSENKVSYDWDEAKNKGFRVIEGTRQLCDDVLPDNDTGFMRCIWHGGSSGLAASWLSEMSILDYDKAKPKVFKKPAGATKGKPIGKAAVEKKEYSKIYHQVKKEASANGASDDEAKKKAQMAAKKTYCEAGF